MQAGELRYVWRETSRTRCVLDVSLDLDATPGVLDAVRKSHGVASAYRETRYSIIVFFGRAFDADMARMLVIRAIAASACPAATLVDLSSSWAAEPAHADLSWLHIPRLT